MNGGRGYLCGLGDGLAKDLDLDVSEGGVESDGHDVARSVCPMLARVLLGVLFLSCFLYFFADGGVGSFASGLFGLRSCPCPLSGRQHVIGAQRPQSPNGPGSREHASMRAREQRRDPNSVRSNCTEAVQA